MSKSVPELLNEAVDFKSTREKIGISVKEVSALVGRSPRTIYRWENGQSSIPDFAVERLHNYVSKNGISSLERDSGKRIRFIDLFAGIGGFRLAFERIGAECVFTSEWDKFARQTYAANFEMDESHPFAADITQVDIDTIPKHDLLVAGFPCQPFSIAGVSKKNSLGRPHGFQDETQGTLFFNIKQILDRHEPAAFLLENVKNLVSHDKKRTYKVIERTLEGLGYIVRKRVINAKSYLPQNRERIFIVGFRKDVGFDFEKMCVPDVDSGPELWTILHREDGTEPAEPPYTCGPMGTVNEKYTLTPKLWAYLQAYAEKHRKKGNGFGFGLVGPNDTSRTLSARYYKDGSEILIRQEGERPRRLTPRECAKLMGFVDTPHGEFNIPVSDTQAYKQFGNAVAVPVAEAVARYMERYILQTMELMSAQRY